MKNAHWFGKLPPLVAAHGVGTFSGLGCIVATGSGVPMLSTGAVGGVFFVFVAVVVIVVTGGAAGGEAVEDETA